MGKIDDYIEALETLGDGRYHYYDGRTNGIGCSEYTRLALVQAGIINRNESFHAASAYAGVLEDSTRFQKIPWSVENLQRGDIMWSHGYHVATWDGQNGVYEAAPESSHGICANGQTGVGHWPSHTYYNCGTGTNSWSCLYRIIDLEEIKESIDEALSMDKNYHLQTIIDFLPEIKYGSSGSTVKAIQTILKKYGWYADSIDGYAGSNTVNGIKLLQTAMGVEVDGCIGKDTWSKLL